MTATATADTVGERELAYRTLRARDDCLARLIDECGMPDPFSWHTVEAATDGDVFGELVLHVIGHRAGGDGALRVYLRLRDALGGTIDPASTVVASPSDLRAAGLPGAQARVLLDLAQRVLDGRLSFARLARCDDAEAQAELERVHGIATWAAQMLLMHQFRRSDVLPAGDAALLDAARSAFDLSARPTPAVLARRASLWRPFRSYASAVLWAAIAEHPYEGA